MILEVYGAFAYMQQTKNQTTFSGQKFIGRIMVCINFEQAHLDPIPYFLKC